MKIFFCLQGKVENIRYIPWEGNKQHELRRTTWREMCFVHNRTSSVISPLHNRSYRQRLNLLSKDLFKSTITQRCMSQFEALTDTNSITTPWLGSSYLVKATFILQILCAFRFPVLGTIYSRVKLSIVARSRHASCQPSALQFSQRPGMMAKCQIWIKTASAESWLILECLRDFCP